MEIAAALLRSAYPPPMIARTSAALITAGTRTPFALVAGIAFALVSRFASAAVGDERWVEFNARAAPATMTLVADGRAAPLLVDARDFPGVLRATGDLKQDFVRVTGIAPVLGQTPPPNAAGIIIVGTLGRSEIVDRLIAEGKIDARAIAGKWESFLIQVVEAPLPGVAQALVIAGSDQRGTIYGAYELSEQIGVSPWYWWADSPAEHHDAISVKPGVFVQGPPSVKYRGIFLNDEAPDLTNWVRAKFGAAPVRTDPPVPEGIANYNHEFYGRMFEVILRLRGNYLWPAMWNNAFNEDDPENARLADEYGVVMGTSHQEPMLRAQKEWDRRFLKTLGTWNYAKQPDVLENFWREGVRRNRSYESIVTLGLRGANDTEMAPGGPAANRALLEQIVGVQRQILREEVNPDLTKIPQLWCLYKEVQDYYEAGMRVPDDVTLLWADDNWGNLRRLPTAEERNRTGGAGVYYHFDYHGGPRSYQWINTNPIPKIWEQLSLAKQYGADRIWIVNVGHFKGYELPTEFFLQYAWHTERWTNENLPDFTRAWATREFGAGKAGEIADILAAYTRFNGRRKPELLAPKTYSLVNYQEAERVVADFQAITRQAGEIFQTLPAAKRDAFYQLVLFPTQASALVNELYFAAGQNALYAQQHRAATNDFAAKTRKLFQADLDLMAQFNTDFAGGRWAHFMDQSHLGYTTWRDPPTNSLDAIKLAEISVPAAATMGAAVEGSETAWPGAATKLELPRFDALNRQRYFVDVFNQGETPFEFTASANADWIIVSEPAGRIEKEKRLWVSVDWSQAPDGFASGVVIVKGAGGAVSIEVNAVKPKDVTRESLRGFAEDAGFVSIEPEHFTAKIDDGENRWMRIDGYGRTLSGMRSETGELEAGRDVPDASAAARPESKTAHACLEYRMYLYEAGKVEVTAITAPTLNFAPGRGLRYAISFDDETPQIVDVVRSDYRAAQRGNVAWEKSVTDNAHHARSSHTLTKPGDHTLKIWMVDPAVVLQKVLVDLGGLKPSYLGPPESFHRIETLSSTGHSPQP